MNAWAIRIARFACTGAALLVLLAYAPALQAPFLAPKFASLEIMAGLGLLAFALRRCSAGAPRWSRTITFGVLLVLTTSLAAWVAATARPEGSPYALDALLRWGALLGLACGASVLADDVEGQTRVVQAITMASATVALLGLLQHAGLLPLAIPVFSTPGSTFGNRNLAAEVMALGLPFGIAITLGTPRGETRVALLVATALELVYLAVTRARGAWMGAALGVLLVLWLRRRALSSRARIVSLVMMLLAIVAASVPGRLNAHDAGDAKRYADITTFLEGSFDAQGTAWRTRLGFWRRSVAMVRDSPWTGVGPGNWPVVFPRYAEPDATRDGVLSATLAPRQAHDDLLERTAETGLAGGYALVFLAFAVATTARRHLSARDAEARTIHVGAAGALVALAVISLASFPLEMPGTIALGGIALGFLATDAKPSRGPSRSPVARGVVFAALAALAVVVGVGVRAERRVRGSYWLGVAERALHKDKGQRGADDALPALARSLGASPHVFLAELRTAQMHLRLRHPQEAIDAATRATAIELNSPNAWVTLGEAHVVAGQREDAQHDAARALALLHDYPLAREVKASAEARDK